MFSRVSEVGTEVRGSFIDVGAIGSDSVSEHFLRQ